MFLKEKLEYKKYIDLKNKYYIKVSRLANIRLFLFLILVISFIFKHYYLPLFFQLVFIISLVMFIVMVFVHDKYYKIYDYYLKYVEILEEYLARENGKWKEFKDNGEDFFDNSMSFLSDLDILGNCSLFQYLNTCKTLGGRRRLFRRLSNIEMSAVDLKHSQELVVELTQNFDFSIRFQILMKSYEGQNIDLEKGLTYLDNNIVTRKIDFFVGIVASLISILLFLLGCFGILSFSYFYGMFLFNLMISYLYALIFKEEFFHLDNVVNSYGKLSDVFKCISNSNLNSVLMKKMHKHMENGLEDVGKLKKIDSMNSLKKNLLTNLIFNGFGCLNLFLLYRFSKFSNCNLDNLKVSIYDVEELEMFVSLSTLGIVRTNCCIPKVEKKVSILFSNIKHPLLNEQECVGNDFSTYNGVNIITGSNMGGKTSFLRMIGINIILMNAGGYVCADEFSSSYFKIFTSMRVLDNIEKGISTFYGELLRIQEMVEYVDKGKMLVLIDEIFKGTNYQDRIYGACEVIKKLNTKNTVTFITTHDFELCEERHVHNYHVKEDYEGDKIIFDYKIRSGKCSSTNAKYLMKKLGIIN